MKKIKLFLTIISAALCAVMALGGCGGDYKLAEKHTAEDYATYYFDERGETEMPIGGYIGPPTGQGHNGNYFESQITSAHYKLVKEAGLNFILGMKEDYSISRQNAMDSLKYAGENDVMFFVRDNALFDLYNNKPALEKDAFEKRLKQYSQEKAFAGLIGRDEPWGNLLDDCGAVQDVFNQIIPKTSSDAIYFNSLSYQCPPSWFGGGATPSDPELASWTLDKYMSEYFKNIKDMKFYTYDLYPFYGETGYVRSTYFTNLDIVKKYTDENKVPFWTFIQAGGMLDNDPTWRVPNEGEIAWQINTSLAYGAKGYQFFPYNTPAEFTEADFDDVGLINRAGKKTPMYYFAQNANKQTRACEKVLMQSKCNGIMTHGNTPAIIPGGSKLTDYRELKSLSGDDSLVGCFDYKGGTAYYVVNNSISKDKAKITLNFNNNLGYTVTQRATTRETSGKSLTLTLAEGEAALVVLK